MYNDNDMDFEEFWGLESTILISISSGSIVQKERNTELS